MLPTNRIGFEKQIEILRAFGVLCSDAPRIVTNSEIGSIVGYKADTVALGNSFFSSIGLLTKGEGGHIPADELVSFARAHEWTPDDAFRKVAPILRNSWFGVELLTKLRFRQMSYDECVGILGQMAGVGPESRTQVAFLIEFLMEAGLIVQDSTGQISRQNGEHAKPDAANEDPPPPPPPPPSSSSTEAGRIKLNIQIDVNTAQIARWSPDRITAFMTGLAQVLTAQGQSESAAS
jgi:hypothetical protein